MVYETTTPDQSVESKVYQVNHLRKWKTREEEANLPEDLGPSRKVVLQPPGALKTGENLTESQRETVMQLQSKYPEVFSKQPGRTRLVSHKVVVKEQTVVRLFPRKWPKHLEEALVKEVQTMLKLGLIEPSQSEWCSQPSDGTQTRWITPGVPQFLKSQRGLPI